jgi:ribonuclease HIII
MEFLSKTTAVTVTGFKSGKVMFQGPIAESEYRLWRDFFKKDGESIGSDEVGTGDFFGPIVVVAAYVNESQIDYLKDLGVGDSKTLNDDKIFKIGKEIKDVITHKEVFLENAYYNKLYNKTSNLNKIKALMHNRALNELTRFTKCEEVIVDEFTPEAKYYKYLEDEIEVYSNIKFEQKAESKYISVATASVLARYYFLVLWTRMESELGMKLPKGAGAQVDKAARKLLDQYDEATLSKYAKMHFKNLQKAKNLK